MVDVSEISGFTPGPWYIGDINANPDDGVVGEVAICVKTNGTPQGFVAPAVALPFGDHSPGRAMAMANARLIAAAPDMHAEIVRLRKTIDDWSRGMLDDWSRGMGFNAKDAEIARLNELLRGVGANRYWEGRWRDADRVLKGMDELVVCLRRDKDALMEAIKTIASLDNEDLYHGHVDGKPTNTATQLALAALRSATETKGS